MHMSLNETGSLALKAALGAGATHGASEDAAVSVGWLAARGFDGAGLLAAALGRVDAGEDSYGEATCLGGDWAWRATDGARAVSAALIGAGATDLVTGKATVHMDACACPGLLLAHAANRATQTGGGLLLTAGDADSDPLRLIACPDGRIDGDVAALVAVRDPVTVSIRAWRDEPAAALHLAADMASGLELDAHTVERLAALAHRTYVPATEDSRLRGAGAGLTDND